MGRRVGRQWSDLAGIPVNIYYCRFRVMADCYFGLLRNYIRVDDVLVRVFDTRIYHEFQNDYIIREFSVNLINNR